MSFKIGDLVEVKDGNTPWFHEMEGPFEVIGIEVELGDTFITVRDQNGMEEHGWGDWRFQMWEPTVSPEEITTQWWLEEGNGKA